MTTTIDDFKRGGDFELTCKIDLTVGNTLSGIRCHVRKGSALVQSLTVTVLAPTLTEYVYRLSATAAQTALWPKALLRSDIEYSIGGKIAHTDTYFIDVIGPETL